MDDVDEAADDLRLAMWRAEDDGSVGKLVVAGEEPARVPLGEGVLRWSRVNAADVEMGVRRVVWWCLGGPQGCCWLLI